VAGADFSERKVLLADGWFVPREKYYLLWLISQANRVKVA
jgi:hypothetical protein